MKGTHVAFFTEAGYSRGMGHLIRSFTISEKFRFLGIKTSLFLDSNVLFDDKFKDITYFDWSDFELTNKYIFTVDNYDSYNLSQFVKKVKDNNLMKCNYLISADFNYENLSEKVIFSIISLYFMLHAEGVYAVSFDDHIFHKVRDIGKNVSNYIDNLVIVDNQDMIVKDAIDFIREKDTNSIVIWGTGEFSKYLFDTATEHEFVISGIVDGMEEKWGSDFMGFEVQSPQSLIDSESDIVIASVNFYGEIFNKLISLGISKDRVIPNFLL